jgi:probable HAF family extracellular repeat protein
MGLNIWENYVFRINERGQVIYESQYDSENGYSRAVLWQKGILTDLGTLGGPMSTPYAINERGQVVGQSLTASDEWHAFLWSK